MNLTALRDDSVLAIGDGFSLSAIVRSDKAAYLEHLSDPTIAQNTMAIPFPYTAAHADAWLDHCEAEATNPEKRFALRDDSGLLIGSIGIVGELPPGAHRAEIGYWLAASWRGRGIMPRAIDVFALHCFTTLRLHRLSAVTFVGNVASQRALEKAGFQREGMMRHFQVKEGAFLDAVLHARLSSDR